MFDIRGKNSGVYNFSSEKRKLAGHYSRMIQVPVEVSSYNYVQSKILTCVSVVSC